MFLHIPTHNSNSSAEETEGPRDLFEYFFRVPQTASHLNVRADNGRKIAGFSGSFEVEGGRGTGTDDLRHGSSVGRYENVYGKNALSIMRSYTSETAIF